MSRYRHRRSGRPIVGFRRDDKRCPTCGRPSQYRSVASLRRGRPIIPPHDGPGRPIRVTARKVTIVHVGNQRPRTRRPEGYRSYTYSSFAMSRTWARCSDAFHNVVMPEDRPVPIPRGRIGDNSDLRRAKTRLSRALQGKDRR